MIAIAKQDQAPGIVAIHGFDRLERILRFHDAKVIEEWLRGWLSGKVVCHMARVRSIL